MKKIVSIFLLQALILCLAFGATINSKEGYKELSWGSTVEDAKKEGYKLTLLDKSYSDNLYSLPVDAYKVVSKDKKVSALQFHYYMGSLFFVSETIKAQELDPQKLSSRYGNFNQRGISLAGKQYTDAKIDNDGSVVSLSISLSANSSGNITATMYDWNTYRFISFAGQKLANRGEKLSIGTKNSIADELTDMANDLTKSVEGNKPRFAFLPLTTDYKNVLTEDYVTEELSRAMFKTGKILLVERKDLDVVLNEQKFQASGLVDESTAKSIGKFTGAAFVCYGTIRDLGDRLILNVRVIDVELGELFAISRATVKKDDYLKQRKQTAEGERKSTASSKTKTETKVSTTKTVPIAPTKTTTTASNSAWKVTSYNDNFGGAKVYVFTVNSSDSRMLFLRYQKANNSANSKVVAGIHWTTEISWGRDYNKGTYDIKGTNGKTVTKELDADDFRCFMNSSESNYFIYAWTPKDGSRWLVDIMKNSDSVAVRHDGLSRRFQTSGLLNKMAEYGITWAEIDAAISNEEF